MTNAAFGPLPGGRFSPSGSGIISRGRSLALEEKQPKKFRSVIKSSLRESKIEEAPWDVYIKQARCPKCDLLYFRQRVGNYSNGRFVLYLFCGRCFKLPMDKDQRIYHQRKALWFYDLREISEKSQENLRLGKFASREEYNKKAIFI